MIHEMGLQAKYYDFIKNGTKRIELRLYDEKRQQIQIGDKIEFSKSNDDKIQVKVIDLLRYDTFDTLFNDFDVSILADKSMTKNELKDALNEFYPVEKQKKIGVIGIRVDLI